MTTSSVIVVGAGIAGASTAFSLASKGIGVTVVDDGAPGQATAASAGIIAPWTSQSEGRFYELYSAGGAFYPALLDRLAEVGITRTDYRRNGALVVNRDPSVLDDAEKRVRARVAHAGPVAGEVQRVDPAEARELFPPLARDMHALLVTGGGRVDGRTLRDALLDGAVRRCATRVAGEARLVRGDGGTVVEVDGTVLEADAVVVTAAGAWSTDLLSRVGAAVPMAPQRGQITHLRLERVDTTRWPTINQMSHHYVVCFDDSRVVVGATAETGSGFDPRVTAAGQLQVLQDALSIAPGLADATVLETRVGLRPLSDDLPVVGRVPGEDALWVATGYGAFGLTMGPLLGDALARAVVGEDAPELDGIAPERA